MLALLLTPAYAPFAIAFAVMIGIGLIEAIGLGVGQLDLDGHVDADIDGHIGADLLGWLGLGAGLPILVWLTSLLGCFTIAGIAVQQIAAVVVGAPLAWTAAAAAALVIGGIANIFAAAGLARVMPGYESTIVSADDLVRLRGTILEGTARRGHPARAKVVDRYGQAHYIMVEPHHDDDIIPHGETALVVRKTGAIFFVLPDASPALSAV